MTYLRRPWTFLTVLFVVILSCFSVIKWCKYRSRQARLCDSSVLCRIKDLSSMAKLPAVDQASIRPLYEQPLFFLGVGKQCVAYETADGRYILKLFRGASKKKKQLEEYVAAGIIARTLVPEETGVIACVCGPQSFKLPTVTVLDKRGKIKHICLQDIAFIFQRKALPFKQTLMRLVAEKKTKEAAARIESLFSLLTICRDRGVLDRDGSLIRNGNLGIIDGKVILLDTGKLCRIPDREKITLHDLNRLKPLQSWLASACPDLVPVFKACQEKYHSTIINRAFSL